MGHNVLKPRFPMIGFDLHGEMAVPLTPTPSFPHVCFSVLNGISRKRSKTSTVSQDGGSMIIHRTSDIGNLIPHVPIPPTPNVLFLPLIILFSGSKSYFGPASVQAEGKVIGCALLFVVDINGNCWDILSAGTGLVAPTGLVITWNTVKTSLTWGDVLGGFIAMAIDAASTALLSLGSGKLAKALSKPLLSRVLGTRLGNSLAWKLIGRYGLFAMPMAKEVLEKTLGGITLFLTGSPLGHSAPNLLGSPYDLGSLGTEVGYGIGNAITGYGSIQSTVGTTDGNVPSPTEQQARRETLQQPVPERTPTPDQPGGDLANQPVEEW